MKIALAISVTANLLLCGVAMHSYQRGEDHGQQLMRETMEAEAISQGAGEFGPDGSFRFKKPKP